MRNRLAYIILFFALSACSQVNRSNKSSSCTNDLQKFLITNWSFNKDSAWYEGTQTLYGTMDTLFKPCIFTLNAGQVELLFGKPSYADGVYYRYNFAHCSSDLCNYYEFLFDNNKKVKNFTRSYRVRNIDTQE
jgi:hypothetical protein